MSFHVNRKGALEYLTSDVLQGDIVHCFSTRLGGVSEGHLSSLNLGVHRGDVYENVVKNYQILGDAVGFDPKNTVFTHQVHSTIVEKVDASECGNGLFREVTVERDGLVTLDQNVALVVFSADCTPILLHDPVSGAIGAVHSGWRGTAHGIVKNAVEKMAAEFGAKPADLQVAIGPCISQCCFETDADVPNAMLESLGEAAKSAIQTVGQKYHVDLKQINRIWLERCGVTKIDISPDCTCCQPDRFWTHRKVGNQRGSLAAIIMRKGAKQI